MSNCITMQPSIIHIIYLMQPKCSSKRSPTLESLTWHANKAATQQISTIISALIMHADRGIFLSASAVGLHAWSVLGILPLCDSEDTVRMQHNFI